MLLELFFEMFGAFCDLLAFFVEESGSKNSRGKSRSQSEKYEAR